MLNFRKLGLSPIATFGIAAFCLVTGTLWGQQSLEGRLNAMLDLRNHSVYVAAHRGDWRDAPENSIRSLKWAARLGVDVVEFDLKRTRDGKLVVMHDSTLNRTTTGTGPVADRTLEEIKALRLRAATGHPTADTIPTLAEELEAAHQVDVLLDIDQGWDYLPEVIAEVRASHAMGQVIINVFPNTTYSELQRKAGDIPEDATLMIVVNVARPDAANVIESYKGHKRTIVQCIFADDQLPSVLQIPALSQQFPIWINSLWPDQNANHDDERALGDPNGTWGWLIAHGATTLQTDRPRELREYLREKHLQ